MSFHHIILSLTGRIDLTVELYFLFLQHLLEDFSRLCLAVRVVKVSLVDCFEEQMYFFRGFGSISIENAENESFNDVPEVTFHGSTFFEECAFHVIVHIVFYALFILLNWLIIHYFSIFEGVQTTNAGSISSKATFLQHSFVHPERHLLFKHIVRNLQLITQLLRANTVFCIFELALIKVSNQNGLER